MVVVDSQEDLNRVSAAAVAAGVQVKIGVRVTPLADENARYIGKSSKLGVDWRERVFFFDC